MIVMTKNNPSVKKVVLDMLDDTSIATSIFDLHGLNKPPTAKIKNILNRKNASKFYEWSLILELWWWFQRLPLL